MLLSCASAAVACNGVFDITEGAPRHEGAAGLGTQRGGASTGATGGMNGIPTGGTTSQGGASAGGAVGLSGGTGNAAGAGANGGSGGNSANGGMGAAEGGTEPGTGGTTDHGGTGANGGSTSGDGGTGGQNGGASGGGAGMGGTAGLQEILNIVDYRDFLIWPKCDEDNAGFETTCKFYGMQGPSACSNPALPFDQRGAFLKGTIPIGGSNGTTYAVQVRVFGAATTRCYESGQLAPVNTVSGTQNLYVGGEPTDSSWTSFELHVYDKDAKPQGVYYLNALPHDDETSGVACETYSTQQLFNEITLELPGAGYVEWIVHDTDCVMDTNCESNTSWCAPIGQSAMSVLDMLGPPFVEVDTGKGDRMIPVDTRWGEQNTAQYPQYMYVDVKQVNTAAP
ncbi:MAG TPA: hypothetical protein VFV94_10495 [Polyangiaceae bacterium]|nr:hypothetical protein [Polyangiaceae bacterium]